MSLKEIWRLGARNDAVRVDSRGRATIDPEKFVKNKSVRATVDLLKTKHRAEIATRQRKPIPA